MTRPVALASYQWPPSNEVIAEKVGLDPRDIIRFDGNVAATPPRVRARGVGPRLADVNEYDRGRYHSLRAAIAHVTAWALIRSRSGPAAMSSLS